MLEGLFSPGGTSLVRDRMQQYIAQFFRRRCARPLGHLLARRKESYQARNNVLHGHRFLRSEELREHAIPMQSYARRALLKSIEENQKPKRKDLERGIFLQGTPIGSRITPARLTAPRVPTRRPVSPVDLVKPCREGRADEQIIVAVAGWDTPAQSFRAGENFVGAGCQLVTVDAGDVRAAHPAHPMSSAYSVIRPPSMSPTKALPRSDFDLDPNVRQVEIRQLQCFPT